MLRLTIFTLLLFILNNLSSQLSFSKDKGIYKNRSSWSGIAGGFADVNGDLADDIVLLNKGRLLQVGFNTGKNSPLKWSNEIAVFQNSEYALAIGDLDNDYKQELISNGAYSGTKVYKYNEQGDVYFYDNVPTNVYSQATNLVDINNDGFLDMHICHDEGNNVILINDGLGNLVEQTIIDFSTIPVSDNSGSYGSEWIDIDNDGDQDLYIAKCKFGVSDPEDPRRHNMLFINHNGTFINEAEVRGLKIKAQSWTGSFADFDNDGDYDCFTSNHDVDHILMKNDSSGHFIPYETNIPFNKTFSFQVLLADYDNNGFVDILVTAPDRTSIYLNLDGENFEKTNLFDEAPFSSATFGDVNDDGFLDIISYYSVSINLPGSKRDELFINNGNENSYAKFTLKGDSSNANGVGARLNAYSESGIKTRQVQAGVSYGITNTLTQHFGFGQDTLIDSLVVFWPSGIVDKYYNLDVNNHYLIQEAKCISKKFDLMQDKEILCKNDTVTLSTENSTFVSYNWSNGFTGPFSYVTGDNSVFLIAKDTANCEFISNITVVKLQDLKDVSLITNNADTIFICKDAGEVLYKNDFVTDIIWQDGSTEDSYLLNEAGEFIISATDACGENYSDTLIVKLVSDHVSSVIKLKVGVDTTLNIDGDRVEWYSDEEKTNLLTAGNIYTVTTQTDTTNLYVNITNKKGEGYSYLGINSLPTSNQYASDQIDGGLYINVFDTLVLKSFVANTDKEGIRKILIISYEGDTIFSKEVFIEKDSLQRIVLDALVPPGTLYQLKTDHLSNLGNFGHEGPRLIRTGSGVNYPYLATELAEIPTSTKGSASYYYFYNIELEKGGVTCTDDIIISIIPDTIVSNNEITLEHKNIYPNPTSSEFFIKSDNKINNIKMIDVFGKVIYTDKNNPTKVSVEKIPAGIYIIEVTEENSFSWRKKVMVVK